MQKTPDNSFIFANWRNRYELAASSYSCCIVSDCRFRLLVLTCCVCTLFGRPGNIDDCTVWNDQAVEKAIRWVATGNHCNYCTCKWSFPVYLSPSDTLNFKQIQTPSVRANLCSNLALCTVSLKWQSKWKKTVCFGSPLLLWATPSSTSVSCRHYFDSTCMEKRTCTFLTFGWINVWTLQKQTIKPTSSDEDVDELDELSSA